MLSVLRHLNYKAWFAIAEFVDNSLQSYLSNQAALRAAEGDGYRLKIRVWLDQKTGSIEITDNAAGISAGDFPRAFRAAEVPPDRKGLSEFGMGMKSAACWFTDTWSVRTKALGESVERLVRFDIPSIVSHKSDVLEVVEVPADPATHYTVVRLENLGRKFPQTKTQSKLKDHLASIYRQFLRRDDIELYFDESKEPLRYSERKSLLAAPVGTPGALPVEWRKEIDFDFGFNQRVWGFAGILAQGSTTHAGFALFRRNRLIVGSDDETYRPQAIFGNSNSFRYQRIYGELHVEGFEVSHTKDGFRWDEFEEDFLELLKDHLQKEPLDLLKQAEAYRSRPTKEALEPKLRAASASLKEEVAETASAALSSSPQESVPSETPATPQAVPQLVTSEELLDIKVDDQRWLVTVRTSVDPAVSDWLQIGEHTKQLGLDGMDERHLSVDISMAHPFVRQYIGPQNENAALFVRMACGIALSLLKAQLAQGYPLAIPLYHLNRLLREALARGV